MDSHIWTNSAGTTSSLYDLLSKHRHTECVDPREKVCALRALAIDIEDGELVSNFEKGAPNIYWEVLTVYKRTDTDFKSLLLESLSLSQYDVFPFDDSDEGGWNCIWSLLAQPQLENGWYLGEAGRLRRFTYGEGGFGYTFANVQNYDQLDFSTDNPFGWSSSRDHFARIMSEAADSGVQENAEEWAIVNGFYGMSSAGVRDARDVDDCDGSECLELERRLRQRIFMLRLSYWAIED